jgi:hypothetical protein
VVLASDADHCRARLAWLHTWPHVPGGACVGQSHGAVPVCRVGRKQVGVFGGQRLRGGMNFGNLGRSSRPVIPLHSKMSRITTALTAWRLARSLVALSGSAQGKAAWGAASVVQRSFEPASLSRISLGAPKAMSSFAASGAIKPKMLCYQARTQERAQTRSEHIYMGPSWSRSTPTPTMLQRPFSLRGGLPLHACLQILPFTRDPGAARIWVGGVQHPACNQPKQTRARTNTHSTHTHTRTHKHTHMHARARSTHAPSQPV